MCPGPELGLVLTIILSWAAGAMCVCFLVLLRINPEEGNMQEQTPNGYADTQMELKRLRAIEWLGTRWVLHPQYKGRKS
jgi:hypothetical protein